MIDDPLIGVHDWTAKRPLSGPTNPVLVPICWSGISNISRMNGHSYFLRLEVKLTANIIIGRFGCRKRRLGDM